MELVHALAGVGGLSLPHLVLDDSLGNLVLHVGCEFVFVIHHFCYLGCGVLRNWIELLLDRLVDFLFSRGGCLGGLCGLGWLCCGGCSFLGLYFFSGSIEKALSSSIFALFGWGSRFLLLLSLGSL